MSETIDLWKTAAKVKISNIGDKERKVNLSGENQSFIIGAGDVVLVKVQESSEFIGYLSQADDTLLVEWLSDEPGPGPGPVPGDFPIGTKFSLKTVLEKDNFPENGLDLSATTVNYKSSGAVVDLTNLGWKDEYGIVANKIDLLLIYDYSEAKWKTEDELPLIFILTAKVTTGTDLYTWLTNFATIVDDD